MRRVIILAVAAGFWSSGAAAQIVKCTPTQKLVCTQGMGCEASKLDTWSVIDFEKKTYARCGAEGCDNFPAVVSDAGTYTNIELPGRTTFAKVSDDSKTYSEIAAVLSAVFISFGACTPAK